MIGTRDRVDLDRFLRLGFFLGAAFQVQDDLLNLAGDEASYGKELDGDIWEGKRTIMLIHLLQHASAEERIALGHFLGRERGERKLEEIRWVRQRMDVHASLDYARAVAHGLAGAARHEFEQVFASLPDSRDKRFVASLVPWMIERS